MKARRFAGGRRTFARGTVCAGGWVWPTPAAPLTMSASNLSAESWMPLAACVRVSAPLMPEVALVLLPPRKGHLSKRRTRPPCSSTVCAAERPARPPPMTMICSSMSCAASERGRSAGVAARFGVRSKSAASSARSDESASREIPIRGSAGRRRPTAVSSSRATLGEHIGHFQRPATLARARRDRER